MRAKLTCIASLGLTAALFVTSLRYMLDFWLLAFVNSFQLHIGLACAVVSLLCIIILRSRAMTVLLLWATLLSGHAFYMHKQFVTDATPGPSAQPFRLMSFNVLMENARNAGFIADAMLASNADVVFVMEADALSPVMPRLLKTYPYRLGCQEGTLTCDLLILSKRPLLEARFYSLSDLRRDRFAMASIDLDGTKLTLAAAHMTKPYFDDYHSYELDQASELLFKVTGPLILAGDFNSASIAPDMQNFMHYNDLEKAPWEPATWPIEAGRFGIAIDHVFARKPATLMKTERMQNDLGSNHYGLISDFMIEP